MKALFIKYKSVVTFLLLFLGSYLILSVLYAGYLSFSEGSTYHPDIATHLVAKQSSALMEGFGYEALVQPHQSEPSMELYVNKKYLARVVEGCNAISIIILFTSFIIAFAQGFRKTFLFLFAGIAIIYGVNLLRIAILAIALYHYPNQEHLLHGVVFPAIIYGIVFILWVFWVRMLTPKQIQK